MPILHTALSSWVLAGRGSISSLFMCRRVLRESFSKGVRWRLSIMTMTMEGRMFPGQVVETRLLGNRDVRFS